MRRTTRNRLLITAAIGAGILLSLTSQCSDRRRTGKLTSITGAVILDSSDPHRQIPIANANITVTSGALVWKSVSEASGLFRVRLEPPPLPEDILNIKVQHPDYQPYAKSTPVQDRLQVIRLIPARPRPPRSEDSATVISNIRIRYTTRLVTTNTVATAVRTFDVINQGNVPCRSHPPCSPDGKWKANIASVSLDAGERRQFRAVRVSCMAGPCPFSSIESDEYARGGRHITVSVRNWSDRVTYLVEADVAETMETSMVRHAFPVALGRFLNFTLPTASNGLAIEADVAGVAVVFPMGPQLRLSWADCRSDTGAQGTRQYQCELKQGYRF